MGLPLTPLLLVLLASSVLRQNVTVFLCCAGAPRVETRVSLVGFLKHKVGKSQKKDFFLSWEGKRGNNEEK